MSVEALAISRVTIEGALAVLMSFVIFFGSIWLLLSAIFGPRMGYLVTATGLFGFMLILSLLWAFGAPCPGPCAPAGIPAHLGPRGELPHWVVVEAGPSLASDAVPVDRYPGGPWGKPEGPTSEEIEPVSLAAQEFLAEEAGRQLEQAGIQGEVSAESFEVENVRFTDVEGIPVAAAQAFAIGGGPEVTVLAYKDPGAVGLPSYLFLAASVIGLAVHLPFLDRAERRRKGIVTGGEQPPWLGPA